MIGHGGVERTLTKLSQLVPKELHWHNMRKDVCTFIRQCPCCIFMQPSKRLISTSAPYNMSVSYPNDRVNIDTVGPLPPDGEGNTHIIAIMDVFSRFIELYPVNGPTAYNAFRALTNWCGRYGIPNETLSDNGPEYVNHIISELTTYFQTNHVTIHPHSHEENTIIERAIQEVQRHLRNIVFDIRVKNEWSLYLPLIQRIMNATKHSALGCAPAEIIYGRALELDQNLLPLLQSRLRHINDTPLKSYLSQAMKMQDCIIQIALKNQIDTDMIHLNRKQLSLKQPYDFKIGQYVIYNEPNAFTKTDARSDKLTPHYKGPFQITDVNSQRINVRNLLTQKVRSFHPAHLHPFIIDTNQVNPLDIAKQANQEYVVDKILKINGHQNDQGRYYKRGLEFQVRWEGYDESEDSWEPYKELRYNTTFIKYCQQNGLRYLIPHDVDQTDL